MFERLAPRHMALAFMALPFAIAAPDAHALSLVYDRADFNGRFTSNVSSTVIDSDGAFAADPAPAKNLPSVIRKGTVGGQSLSYTLYDVDFSDSPDGTITPGSAGGDIDELDNLNVESPASQSGATGTGSWGVDSDSGASSTRNAAVFQFNRSVGHFGLDLHDFESSADGRLGELRIYRNGSLLADLSQVIEWSDDGNDVSHFIGFVAEDSTQFFDAIAFVLGDDDVNGTGRTERWAADNFTFGDASAISLTPTIAAIVPNPAVVTPSPNTVAATAVPTPALLPGLIGFGASLVRKKRQAK